MPEASHLLLSYYGDDYTGSTDVMEALASHGVKTVLFTRRPSDEQREAFASYQAIGLAGTSRSETPDWMDTQLRPAFLWLKDLGAGLCHYKVCSTFDSSPTTGSIGKAIEIGCDVFGQKTVPLIVGAPQLKRYTFAGNLFAAYQGQVYRIDRHPVMSRHPVTPMHEADLRLHLGKQTTMAVGLDSGDGIILIDVFDATTQKAAGRKLLELTARHGPFVAGSSGIDYAVLSAWQEAGIIAGKASFDQVGRTERIVVVSGSVSPTTERQIRYALAQGFEGIAVDPLELASGRPAGDVIARGLKSLAEGKSVIVYTALGSASDRGASLDGLPQGRHELGKALGRIVRALIEGAKLRRAILAGGDTSSHALGELDIYALTTRMPLPATPGSPICIAHSDVAALDGLEIAMKGGQIGGDDYFTALRDGI
ncbi:MAG: four-carbon acid sugar kinase family protein [Parvibaculaceae bacterium]